ncbi:hypothetical protein [Desulfovibrio falkowii]|uniref:Tail fiber protein n=1 Tax=Desulfovibrio falkowii TaxID=3136602 RepID=A0ABQ0E9V1_9BACT
MGRPTDPNFWQQSPPPQTGDMNNERTLNQRFMRELPGALPPQDVIIHDGAISGFESAALIVDTEGEAAADELNVINIVLSANENLHPGMIITLRAKDQARTVTVKNSAAANGINTAGGHDVVLSTEWDLVLRLVAGRWYEIQTRGDVRASDAQTDASTALARTAPATTTSRGISRVATLADMEPGVTVENGPAVIDAKGGVITTTPTAHAVPQADASGKLDGWVSLSTKANTSLNNITSAAGNVIRSNMTLRSLGTRTTAGTWTLTNVEVGRPLFVGIASTSSGSENYAVVKAASGSIIGTGLHSNHYAIGHGTAWSGCDVMLFKPTTNTVVLSVSFTGDGMTLYAEQI